jgi:hypothetical protein
VAARVLRAIFSEPPPARGARRRGGFHEDPAGAGADRRHRSTTATAATLGRIAAAAGAVPRLSPIGALSFD